MAYSYSSNLLPSFPPLPSTSPRRLKPKATLPLSDPFVLAIADKLEDSISSLPPSPLLQNLRNSSSQSLLSQPWPSPKDEPFRFTDTSFLKSSQILPASPPSLIPLSSSSSNTITILDGHVIPSLSNLPAKSFAGSASDIPTGEAYEAVVKAAGDVFHGGDLFYSLNGLGAPELAVVYVSDGERMVEEPLCFRFCKGDAAEGGSVRLPISNPRVLVVVGKGAELVVLEEHFGEGERYWSNSVVEIVMEEGSKVSHTYVQKESLNAAHTKWTFVRQVYLDLNLM